MNEAVIVSAVRSAVGRGKQGGALATTHPIDLSAEVMKAAVKDVGLDDLKTIENVYWGCAMPEASQGLNIGRMSLLRAGFPVEVPGSTINRFCSSGLESVALGAQAIMAGMADVVLTGGVEMMSQVPMSGYHTRLEPEMTESYIGMGFTAERVAERWKVSRADQDAYAARSHQKAAAAWAAGNFADEIVPIPVETATWHGTEKVVTTGVFDRDETVRADTTAEKLAKLQPAFKVNGTVTAGNASPYSDGAAAVLLMSRERAVALGAPILGRFITYGASGVEPDVMGIAPIKAVPKALKAAGMSLADIDLIEMNEAFASQVLAVTRELGMDEAKLNVDGGAIALGHPMGATGAKLLAHLVHALRRRGGGHGLVTMCVGGGMGAAGIFEVYG
jgi:acetyl-CoA acyltransferase